MKDKIKDGSVCFLTFDLAFGGAEKVIVTLANELSLSGRDVSIAILGQKNDFTNILSPNIKIILLNCENIKYSPLTLLNFFYKNTFGNLVANLWPMTALSFLVKLIKPQTNFVIIEHCELSVQFKNKGVNNKRNKKYQFWQQDNHPIELYSNYFIDQKVEYIHNNPVVAGLVEKAEEYIYSSAKNYSGEQGLLKLERF